MLRFTGILFVLAATHAASLNPLPNLMPMPWKVSPGSGRLVIDSGFRIVAQGVCDARLESASQRFLARVFRQAGLSAIHLPSQTAAMTAALTVECREHGTGIPALGEDESYQLDVTTQGAHLTAQTTTGILRGLETFAQLIVPAPDALGFQVPAVHIEDHPRFPWRGLMLDVSRHWMPVAVVRRNLDAMAAVKLNVFHWHLSDDQGFRVESLRFPKLHQLGSDGNYYTQTEVRQVVAYARDRGIRVVPEFDIPGHTTSWLVGYPELGSAPGPYEIQRRWGIFEPTLDPTRDDTYRFLDGFLGEMAALFPDPYFHIGGDEVDDTQWKKSAAIQSFAREHDLAGTPELHAYFNRRVQEILKRHGKIMIGWDEVLAPGLGADTVIQSWRGPDSLADASRKGYRGILSAGYYLDHLLPASRHYGVDPLDGAASTLDASQTARILGGEACMWVEYVSAETVDSRIWPRMAAIAERFWSPRELPKEVKDTNAMYARMEAVSRTLEWVGLRHRANYAPMLDRLAGGWPADALRILADACESLGITVRRDARKYTSLIDLNRFVDAVRPESETVRHMEDAITRTPLDLAAIRFTLRQWAENDHRLAQPARSNEMVRELVGLSKDLSAVGTIGLQALDYLESGKAAPEKWIVDRRQALDAMAKPNAEVMLAAVRPVRLLVDRAAGIGNIGRSVR